MTIQYDPYQRTSEAGLWALDNGNGQVGKPGRYEDPDLWSNLTAAFASLFSPDVRMQEDQEAAAEQGATPPAENKAWYSGLISPFTESEKRWSGMTADFLGTVTTTWTDPDTGKFYYGSGPEVGQQIETTYGALGKMWQGMRGLFNTAYDPDPGNEPKVNALPGQQPTPAEALAGNAGLLLLALAGLWLWSQ